MNDSTLIPAFRRCTTRPTEVLLCAECSLEDADEAENTSGRIAFLRSVSWQLSSDCTRWFLAFGGQHPLVRGNVSHDNERPLHAGMTEKDVP